MTARVVRCVPERYGRYRYLLEVSLGQGRRLAVILKNPSTAGAEHSDPTVGKLEAWARRNGYGSLTIVNLFAMRSTDPICLNRHAYALAVGPENDLFLNHSAVSSDTLILAWGNPNGIERKRYDRRIAEVARLLHGTQVARVGSLTQLGYPRHGLWWES